MHDTEHETYEAVEYHDIEKQKTSGHLNADRADATFGAGYLTQLYWLCHRNMLNNLRNPGVVYIRLAMYTMLCLMIGSFFWDMGTTYAEVVDRLGILYYIAAFLVFMSIAALPFLIQTRAVFEREQRNGAYALAPYSISAFLTSIPGVAVIALVSSAITYSMMGLQGGYGYYFLNLFLALLCAESVMLLLAATVPHYIIGIALGAGIFGFFMLCQGFFKARDSIPDGWSWGYYLAFHTYSFRSFVVREFHGLTFDGPDFVKDTLVGSSLNLKGLLTDTLTQAGVVDNTNSVVAESTISNTLSAVWGGFRVQGTDILKLYDMEDVDPNEDYAILAGYTGLLQVALFLVLWFKYGRKSNKD
jgi:ABC-type multidrug transport system permease subunit